MKRLLIFTLLYCYPLFGQSQRLNKAIIGHVSFQKDSTDWTATIRVKDTVSVLFKMMFESAPQNALPPTTQYLVIYTPSSIEFIDKKRKKIFAFGLDKNSPLSVNKRTYYWSIIGLSKMNPVCYPEKADSE